MAFRDPTCLFLFLLLLSCSAEPHPSVCLPHRGRQTTSSAQWRNPQPVSPVHSSCNMKLTDTWFKESGGSIPCGRESWVAWKPWHLTVSWWVPGILHSLLTSVLWSPEALAAGPQNDAHSQLCRMLYVPCSWGVAG